MVLAMVLQRCLPPTFENSWAVGKFVRASNGLARWIFGRFAIWLKREKDSFSWGQTRTKFFVGICSGSVGLYTGGSSNAPSVGEVSRALSINKGVDDGELCSFGVLFAFVMMENVREQRAEWPMITSDRRIS